jgi:hypothetical protein
MGKEMTEGYYLQYGCGWDALDGWLNFDASPTLRMERIPAVGKALSALSVLIPLLEAS